MTAAATGSAVATAWRALRSHGARLAEMTLRQLLAQGPARVEALSFALDDLLLDVSRERLDAAALAGLFDLARASALEDWRAALFAGEPVNATEGRAALHMALRAPRAGGFRVAGRDVMADVHDTLDRFLAFAEDVRSGRAVGSTGLAFTDVVSIGIGGSDLGPAMAVRALSPDAGGPGLHFVSNVDGAHLADTLKRLDPATTLVIVASKTFTTVETMTNAASARTWVAAALGEQAAGSHFAAVSTNLDATARFGIDAARVFGFWDWVGGRYSVWSAIGLPLAIAVGADGFRRFLAGAHAMDEHFRTAPLEHNLPVVLGLVGVWRRSVLGCQSLALIPYDQRLERFPAYVQQLAMESNGKCVTRAGEPVSGETGAVIWGEAGTNAQHSFFQLLHQGTTPVPVEFIVAAAPRDGLPGHHDLLLANCLAQAQALAFGLDECDVRAALAAGGMDAGAVDRLAPHRVCPGDRTSTIVLHRQLDAVSLGRLIALYEHRVFVESVIWDINPFDQWGVELGKQLAGQLGPCLAGAGTADLDAATAALIARIRGLRS